VCLSNPSARRILSLSNESRGIRKRGEPGKWTWEKARERERGQGQRTEEVGHVFIEVVNRLVVGAEDFLGLSRRRRKKEKKEKKGGKRE
jgi:hypothetical protein